MVKVSRCLWSDLVAELSSEGGILCRLGARFNCFSEYVEHICFLARFSHGVQWPRAKRIEFTVCLKVGVFLYLCTMNSFCHGQIQKEQKTQR